MTSMHTLVLRYPGSCIMFNMVACSRAKKNKTKNDELGDHWEADDEIHLIVRLISGETYPWVVAHYGTRECFKAPLFVPIQPKDHSQGCYIKLHLRDYANRGKNCIKREFFLEFASDLEAETFKFAHNKMIANHYNNNKKQNKKQAASSITKSVQDNNKEEETTRKKRQFKEIDNNVCSPYAEKVARSRTEGVLKNEDVCPNEEEENDEVKEIISVFNKGNADDFLDDCFNETQEY